MFVSQELAQNLIAAIGSIILFNALEKTIGTWANNYAILFVIAGAAGIVFSKKIAEKLPFGSHGRDIVMVLSSIILFLGVKHYLFPLIAAWTWAFLGIGIIMIYFARNIGGLITTR